jgi:signal transduction histidine kinase
MSLAMVREVSRRLRENDEMAIEDLRLKAKELAEAYQQLAELDYSRRQFLTTIAHELRTPLMAASGYMQVILSGKLQEEALSSALNTVGRNLQEITALVNDILFLQEMDLILPEFQPTDIDSVIAIAVEQQRAYATRNKVDLKLTIPPGLPPVNADAKSLVRAFAAILNNAIKFSPDGGEVLIEVSCDRHLIHILFQDHGVGITPEALPKIFDRFFHLDNIGGHLFRGIGLGLSIARQVIEQHHGSIEVRSEPGKGSIFIVHLPQLTKSD